MRGSKKTKKELIKELKALKDSGEIYRALVENIRLGITLIDTNYRIIMMSDSSNYIFNKPHNEFIGKYCFKAFEKRDAVCPHCPGAQAMATGRPAKAESEAVRDDSSRVPVWIHAFPICGADGTVKGFIEVVEDITDRKQAAEALRTSEAQLSNAMKIAKLGHWEYDVADDLFTFNDQFYSIFRASAEQVGGYKMSSARYSQQFLHPNDASLVATEIKKAIEATDPNFSRQLEHRIIYADGETGYIAVRFFIVKDKQGRTVKTYGVNQDITEYKKAEQALRESQEIYKALFEGASEGILVADIETKRFKYANPAICKMLGYTEEELTQLSVSNIHPKNQLQHVLSEFEAQARGEKSLAEALPCLRKDGTIIYADINSANVLIDGVQCNVGFFTDITKRKQTEQELQRAHHELEIRVRERTAELEKAVKRLQNEVSEREKAEEQLLTYQKQLRSLASELSLAEERLKRKLATEVHDHLGQNLAISKMKLESLAQSAASSELTEALKEIHDLIAQAVESTRSLTFELSPPVLYELGFESAVQWLLRQARQQHGLSTKFTDDKHPKPLDDDIRVLLFQAVKELLVNIAKHAKASSVKVATQKVGDQIRVTIEDDGVGFKASRANSQDGTTGGFGLFNIRERLDYIGGHLDITSRTGKGTRITLVAPITHDKEKRKEKQK